MSILASSFVGAFAEIPSQVQPDTGTDVSDYVFYLTANDTYIDFGTNFYSNELYIHDTHVNFTTTALTGVNHPTKSFGIGVENGNATITTISAGTVVLDMDCTAAMRCDALYYYSLPVQALTASGTRILATDFYTDFAEFDAAAAPAAYHNATGDYVQAKVTFSDPTTITFESGLFIYADMGGVETINEIRLYKPNIDTIPRNINIYVSNDPDVWGSPVLSNYTLTQAIGFETVNIADTDGRYVKVEVNTFGDADFIRIAEYDLQITTEQVRDEISNFQTAMYSAFVIAIALILVFLVVPRIL